MKKREKECRKNGPVKNDFFMFFELFFRYIGRMVGLNLMYAVALIPLEFVGIYFYLIMENEEVLEAFAVNPFIVIISFFASNPILLVIFIAGVLLGSCATAGFTYIQRNCARQEHVFLFSDFIEHSKKNAKQACIFGIIDAAFLILQIGLILLYLPRLDQMIYVVPFFISCAVTLIYFFMRYYIYLMMVTFDMKLYAIFKNAFLFAIGGFIKNLFVLVMLGIVFFFAFFNHIIGMLLCVVILYSLMGFIINFSSYPLIKRFLINPYYEQLVEQGGEDKEDDKEAIFKDEE